MNIPSYGKLTKAERDSLAHVLRHARSTRCHSRAYALGVCNAVVLLKQLLPQSRHFRAFHRKMDKLARLGALVIFSVSAFQIFSVFP